MVPERGGSLKGVTLPTMAFRSKAVILIQVCLDYRMSLRSSWVIHEASSQDNKGGWRWLSGETIT